MKLSITDLDNKKAKSTHTQEIKATRTAIGGDLNTQEGMTACRTKAMNHRVAKWTHSLCWKMNSVKKGVLNCSTSALLEYEGLYESPEC